ncbi:ParM/StbA family protein [Mastigocoleus testarum]|nr:ParM/StbA family protein [Mastigocoleus testarum]
MDLLVSLDPGSSMTKVVYHVLSEIPNEPEILFMEPDLLEVSKESIELYESRKIGNPCPENEAWVKLGQEFYAVGFLAQKCFDARSNLEDLKYEKAILKVLAVVGAIAVKHNLSAQLNLSLALLLPYGEWEDRKKLEFGLADALSNFYFRGQHFKVILNVFQCKPEGGGLVLTRSKKLGVKFNSMNIAVLMLGYRDISSVVFEKGVSSGSSDKYGLTWMLKNIKNSTSGQNLTNLVKPVHLSGSSPAPKHFKSLAKSKKEEFRVEEISRLVQITAQSRKEYWNKIRDWISVNISGYMDLIIIGGGTSKYFSKELKKYFSSTEISWAAELERDVILAFDLPPRKDELALRFTDIYGLFLYLQNTVYNMTNQG